MTPSGREPATFRLLVSTNCANTCPQLDYHAQEKFILKIANPSELSAPPNPGAFLIVILMTTTSYKYYADFSTHNKICTTYITCT